MANRTLADQLRIAKPLLWSPIGLPFAARHLSDLLAGALGSIALGLEVLMLLAIPLADMDEPWGTIDRYLQTLTQIGGRLSLLYAAAFLAPMAGILIASYLGGVVLGRQFRVLALVPVVLLPYAFIWSASHMMATIARDVRSATSPIFDFPLFPIIGSCWIWPAVMVAFVTLVGWGARVVNVSFTATAACLNCGYPRQGIESDRCPECGRPFDSGDDKT